MKDRKAIGLTGHRVTSQRTLLLNLIRQGGRHFDADELYRLAREKEAHLSLSTVYRALRLFKKLGLIDELHYDECHHHYEVKLGDHHHLLCIGCGRVIEFEHPVIKQMIGDTARKNSFEITGTELRVEGYCSRCRRKKA